MSWKDLFLTSIIYLTCLGMPRAAVPPMSADPARPLYPRTQFAAGGGQYGSTPRVHVGDTSQPSSGNVVSFYCLDLIGRNMPGYHVYPGYLVLLAGIRMRYC